MFQIWSHICEYSLEIPQNNCVAISWYFPNLHQHVEGTLGFNLSGKRPVWLKQGGNETFWKLNHRVDLFRSLRTGHSSPIFFMKCTVLGLPHRNLYPLPIQECHEVQLKELRIWQNCNRVFRVHFRILDPKPSTPFNRKVQVSFSPILVVYKHVSIISDQYPA